MGYLLSLFLLLIFITNVRARGSVFDVRRFGAVADGKTDNSKALSDAWTKACQSTVDSVVSVPNGTFMVGPVVFEGPCKASNIDFVVTGFLKAPDGRYTVDQDSWVSFQYVNGLTVRGGGTFDGQGATAWRYNDCTTNPNCKKLPVSLRFNFVNDSNVKDIRSLNSKNFHMHIFKCHNVSLDGLTITAPWDSPNTDGMHIAVSSDIKVTRSRIGTGDDCESVGPGTKSLVVSEVWCGPGHGISIGSLGKTPEEEPVTGLVVRNCTFSGTDNGVRIKTWAPSSPGLVNNITFADIFFDGSSIPIIIDQHYCPSADCDIKASQTLTTLYKHTTMINNNPLSVGILSNQPLGAYKNTPATLEQLPAGLTRKVKLGFCNAIELRLGSVKPAIAIHSLPLFIDKMDWP